MNESELILSRRCGNQFIRKHFSKARGDWNDWLLDYLTSEKIENVGGTRIWMAAGAGRSKGWENFRTLMKIRGAFFSLSEPIPHSWWIGGVIQLIADVGGGEFHFLGHLLLCNLIVTDQIEKASTSLASLQVFTFDLFLHFLLLILEK